MWAECVERAQSGLFVFTLRMKIVEYSHAIMSALVISQFSSMIVEPRFAMIVTFGPMAHLPMDSMRAVESALTVTFIRESDTMRATRSGFALDFGAGVGVGVGLIFMVAIPYLRFHP